MAPVRAGPSLCCCSPHLPRLSVGDGVPLVVLRIAVGVHGARLASVWPRVRMGVPLGIPLARAKAQVNNGCQTSHPDVRDVMSRGHAALVLHHAEKLVSNPTLVAIVDGQRAAAHDEKGRARGMMHGARVSVAAVAASALFRVSFQTLPMPCPPGTHLEVQNGARSSTSGKSTCLVTFDKRIPAFGHFRAEPIRV